MKKVNFILFLFSMLNISAQLNLCYLNLSSPTTPTAKVTATSVLPGYEELLKPLNAIDNDLKTPWCSQMYSESESLTIDFNIRCKIDSLVISWGSSSNGDYKGLISIQDGANVSTIKSRIFSSGVVSEKIFVNQNASKLIIKINLDPGYSISAMVDEVTIYGKVLETENTLSSLQVTGKAVFMNEISARNIMNDTTFSSVFKGGKFIGNGSGLTGVPSHWIKDNNTLEYSLGNVGIGTYPASKLHIKDGLLTIDGQSENWSSSGWRTKIKTPINSAWVLNQPNYNGKYMGIGMNSNGWYFISSASASGNTTNEAKYPFYVTLDGKVIAREIEVNLTNWPDHVFKNEYQLLSLQEVESFINENKHLPGVPSESEVLEKGVNLGQMDAILLKKIEELTLYMIALKKENEALQEKMTQLQSRK